MTDKLIWTARSAIVAMFICVSSGLAWAQTNAIDESSRIPTASLLELLRYTFDCKATGADTTSFTGNSLVFSYDQRSFDHDADSPENFQKSVVYHRVMVPWGRARASFENGTMYLKCNDGQKCVAASSFRGLINDDSVLSKVSFTSTGWGVCDAKSATNVKFALDELNRTASSFPRACLAKGITNVPMPVRSTPRGSVTTRLKIGQPVEVLELQADERSLPWARIKPKGWVFANYLDCLGPN
jgi:hypothetical protein